MAKPAGKANAGRANASHGAAANKLRVKNDVGGKATPENPSFGERRRLQRRSSNEVTQRAIKLKLGCFSKVQVACNKNAAGEIAETAVLREVRRCRQSKSHIQATFWAALIREFNLGGTLADGLQVPGGAQPVNKHLDVAMRTAHSSNPAARSPLPVLKLLEFSPGLNETEYYGVLRGSIECPTLSKTASQQLMEGVLRHTARARCDVQWPHYWNHMKDHWDQFLLEKWMKAQAKQLTRAQVLRCWRAELALSFNMEKASEVAMATDESKEPKIVDVEELASSSLVGQELFSPEVMLAELLHFKGEVDRRLKEVELLHFPEDEMAAFREICMRLAENLDEKLWAELDCRAQKLSYLSGSLMTQCLNPNDLWFNSREARIRTLAVSNKDVPRLPWERWLYGEGAILGCPRTIQVPEAVIFDMSNCREFLLNKIAACQPLTLEGCKRIMRQNSSECKLLDKHGFWCDEIFLDTQVDELLEAHCKNMVLSVLPSPTEKRDLAKAEVAGRMLLSGEVITAMKIGLQKELRHAWDLLTEVSEGRGPTAQEVARMSLWSQTFLKKAENFCQWAEPVQEAGKAGKNAWKTI